MNCKSIFLTLAMVSVAAFGNLTETKKVDAAFAVKPGVTPPAAQTKAPTEAKQAKRKHVKKAN